MPRTPATHEESRERGMREIEQHIRAMGGVMTLADVNAYCRFRGWAGFGPTLLRWLEQEGRAEWDRGAGMVTLT